MVSDRPWPRLADGPLAGRTTPPPRTPLLGTVTWPRGLTVRVKSSRRFSLDAGKLVCTSVRFVVDFYRRRRRRRISWPSMRNSQSQRYVSPAHRPCTPIVRPRRRPCLVSNPGYGKLRNFFSKIYLPIARHASFKLHATSETQIFTLKVFENTTHQHRAS